MIKFWSCSPWEGKFCLDQQIERLMIKMMPVLMTITMMIIERRPAKTKTGGSGDDNFDDHRWKEHCCSSLCSWECPLCSWECRYSIIRHQCYYPWSTKTCDMWNVWNVNQNQISQRAPLLHSPNSTQLISLSKSGTVKCHSKFCCLFLQIREGLNMSLISLVSGIRERVGSGGGNKVTFWEIQDFFERLISKYLWEIHLKRFLRDSSIATISNQEKYVSLSESIKKLVNPKKCHKWPSLYVGKVIGHSTPG